MTSGTYLAVIHAVDGLYESVVTSPSAWSDQAFSDWADEALVDATELPREAIRQIRRCLNSARKMAAFWSGELSAVSDHDDWRSRVDISLGPRAWRPTLELAQIGLRNAPSEELYDQVKARFAVVNSERWMDGIEYETWLSES